MKYGLRIVETSRPLTSQGGVKETEIVDDRQITHLICVRRKHLLYDFFLGGCFEPFI